MKTETVKVIKLNYTDEDCSTLEKVIDLLKTLIKTMDNEKCNIISGEYYEDEIDISKDDLKDALHTISHIEYTTEMY